MKTHKNVAFYTFLTIFLLLFISFSEYIYKKIANLKVVVKYIEESNGELITLYIVPITIMVFIYFYFIWINKHKKHDVIFLFVFIVFTVTLGELTTIFKPLPILIFYVVTHLFLWGLFAKLVGIRKSDTDTDSFDIINNDSEITTLKDNKRDCFKYLLKSFMPIIETHTENSLSISISGEWGSGKSSFLNLIKEKLLSKKSNYEILEFYPWRCDSPDSITRTFFSLLADLVASDRQLNRSIHKYISVLLPDSNSFNRLIHSFSNNLNQNDIYDAIDSGLRDYKKKIIVFIDDLDRLEKDELLAILKIIRNSGRLTNLIFISALDRDQVCSKIGTDKLYLEKFFQFDRTIPMFDSMEKSMLFNKLFEENSIILNKQGIIADINDITVAVKESLSNIRDIKIYLSRLNIAFLQQKSITEMSINIIKNMDDSSYEFKHLDELKMSNKKLAIASIMMLKYPDFILIDETYLEKLKKLALHSNYINDKESSEILIEYPNLKAILTNSNLKSLFRDLFNYGGRKYIDINKSLLLYFDNYSSYSIPIASILIHEISCIIENLNMYSFDELKKVISDPVFDFMREDIFKFLYRKLISETIVEKKITLLKLIDYIVGLELGNINKLYDLDEFVGNFYSDVGGSIQKLIEVYLELENDFIDSYTDEIDSLVEFLLVEDLNIIFKIKLPYLFFSELRKMEYPFTDRAFNLFTKYVIEFYLNYDEVDNIIDVENSSPIKTIENHPQNNDLLITSISKIFHDNVKNDQFIKGFITYHNDITEDSRIISKLVKENKSYIKEKYGNTAIFKKFVKLDSEWTGVR
ncbi:MAG: KAP family NTPase [Spirochaetaceae bacterium]